MALSLFHQDREYSPNHYRWRRFLDGYLLVSEMGSWVWLTEGEFALLRHGRLEENVALLALLKEKRFVITEKSLPVAAHAHGQRIESLFGGTYHHVIFLENPLDSKKESSLEKMADFISQSPQKEIVVTFRHYGADSLGVLSQLVEHLSNLKRKKVRLRLEMDAGLMTEELFEIIVRNHVEVWHLLAQFPLPEQAHAWAKELQRKASIQFYIEVSKTLLGKEGDLLGFFANEGFRSYSLRKSPDVSREEFLSFWKKAIDLAFGENRKRNRVEISDQYSSQLLRRLTQLKDVSHPRLLGLCDGAVVSELAYGLDGSVYASADGYGVEIFKLGSVALPYGRIFSGEGSIALLNTSLASNPSLEKNVLRPYLSNSPILNYKESATLIGRQPQQYILLLEEMYSHLLERMIIEKDFLKHMLSDPAPSGIPLPLSRKNAQ